MAKNVNFGWVTIIALSCAVVMGIMSSCSVDDTSYQDVIDHTPAKPDNTPKDDESNNPKDTIIVDGNAWASVLGTQVKNIDGTIHSIIWGKNNAGDSIKAELIYPLDVKLAAPERVVGKRDSTVYYMAEPEVYGSWSYVYSDSIESTRVSRDFLLRENNAGEIYRIRLSYSLRRGYILVKGSRYEFPMPSVTSGYGDHTRQWKENYEMNDSTFLREVLTSSIKFSAQYVESVLTSTTNIDRNGQPKKVEEQSTTQADYYVKGLNSFLGGNKFFNKQTNHWSDGLLYEGSDSYLIVVYNYTVNGDGKESFLSRSTVTVKKSVVGEGNYDAVMCDPNSGEILPGFMNVRGTNWTIEGPMNYPDYVFESHSQQEANNSGIKNQPQDNNATCSAVITVNPGETTIAGYKFFTTTVKTSVHGYTVKVADENLK